MKELAEQMGRSHGFVRDLLSRAKVELSKSLGG